VDELGPAADTLPGGGVELPVFMLVRAPFCATQAIRGLQTPKNPIQRQCGRVRFPKVISQ
jgi:hypothetical protein